MMSKTDLDEEPGQSVSCFVEGLNSCEQSHLIFFALTISTTAQRPTLLSPGKPVITGGILSAVSV